jgi:hypothetical protein
MLVYGNTLRVLGGGFMSDVMLWLMRSEVQNVENRQVKPEERMPQD